MKYDSNENIYLPFSINRPLTRATALSRYASQAQSRAAVSSFVDPDSDGPMDKVATSHELKEFLNNGRLPNKVIEALTAMHTRADEIVKNCQSGFKIHVADFEELREYISVFGQFSAQISQVSTQTEESKKGWTGSSKKRLARSSVASPALPEPEDV